MEDNILIGGIVEEKFLTWAHFVPMPKGYIFWKPKNNDLKSSFIFIKDFNLNNIIENIICEAPVLIDGDFGEDALKQFKAKKKDVPIELRLREASILSRKYMSILFARHNGFSGNSLDILSESIIFLSCVYCSDNSNDKDLPEELNNFKSNCSMNPDAVINLIDKKEYFTFDSSSSLNFGVVWKKNGDERYDLGPFFVFKNKNMWHIGVKSLNCVLLKNFESLFIAQLNAECLYNYFISHDYNFYLSTPISELDLILMDDYPLKRGKIYKL